MPYAQGSPSTALAMTVPGTMFEGPCTQGSPTYASLPVMPCDQGLTPVGGILGESGIQGFPSTMPLYLPGVPCTQGSPTIHEVPSGYRATVDAMFSEISASLGVPATAAQSVPGYDPGNPQMDYVPSSCLATAPVPDVLVSPSASVEGSHSAGYPNCRAKISIFAIPARTSYIEGTNGVRI